MERNNHTQRVAANVRAEMARKRVAQSVVADHLHLSRAAINRRIKGEVPFDISELFGVADVLGLTVSELVGPERPTRQSA